MTRILILVLSFQFISTHIFAACLCPDGSYVSECPCNLCPDGSYVGGDSSCQLAPDGTFIPYRSNRSPGAQLAPDGTFHPDGEGIVMCPDGTYVTGSKCVLMPNGSYIGK